MFFVAKVDRQLWKNAISLCGGWK